MKKQTKKNIFFNLSIAIVLGLLFCIVIFYVIPQIYPNAFNDYKIYKTECHNETSLKIIGYSHATFNGDYWDVGLNNIYQSESQEEIDYTFNQNNIINLTDKSYCILAYNGNYGLCTWVETLFKQVCEDKEVEEMNTEWGTIQTIKTLNQKWIEENCVCSAFCLDGKKEKCPSFCSEFKCGDYKVVKI